MVQVHSPPPHTLTVQVHEAVDRCLRGYGIPRTGRAILVAFSGGPDSTALLYALTEIGCGIGLAIHAVHLDHAMDAGSGDRSGRAAEIALSMGHELTIRRISAVSGRHPGESLEAAARRIRYEFLARHADRVEANWIATAHHAGDQRETILLRLIFGTGIAGLAGIPRHRGRILRPLLAVERSEIETYVARHGLDPVRDPTNLELSTPRNLVRHALLPKLRREEPEIDQRLTSLAACAARAVRVLDRRLLGLLESDLLSSGVRASYQNFVRAPTEIRSHAVASICRAAGAPPPTRTSLSEIERQLAEGTRIGCDLGSGWRLESRAEDLVLTPPQAPVPPFAYTLEVPGEICLPELDLLFRLTRRPVESWMFSGDRRRAGMILPLSRGDRVTIRNRRPGDRLQPLGSQYRRRLKEILIDRKIPRKERDRLPLLCLGSDVVWVPGVTIDESVRLRDGGYAWVAEIENVGEKKK